MSNKSPLQGIPGSAYNPGDKRGDPTQMDAYFTFGLKVGVRLGSDHTLRQFNQMSFAEVLNIFVDPYPLFFYPYDENYTEPLNDQLRWLSHMPLAF